MLFKKLLFVCLFVCCSIQNQCFFVFSFSNSIQKLFNSTLTPFSLFSLFFSFLFKKKKKKKKNFFFFILYSFLIIPFFFPF